MTEITHPDAQRVAMLLTASIKSVTFYPQAHPAVRKNGLAAESIECDFPDRNGRFSAYFDYFGYQLHCGPIEIWDVLHSRDVMSKENSFADPEVVDALRQKPLFEKRKRRRGPPRYHRDRNTQNRFQTVPDVNVFFEGAHRRNRPAKTAEIHADTSGANTVA